MASSTALGGNTKVATITDANLMPYDTYAALCFSPLNCGFYITWAGEVFISSSLSANTDAIITATYVTKQ